MRLALFEPDIPQNTGTLMRLCACLRVPLDIIEPCGFPLGDKSLKRAGMDYLDNLDLTRHVSWRAFCDFHADRRIILMTTKSSLSFLDFHFDSGDIILAGRESAGVPQDVHDAAAARLRIPMAPEARSVNVATAAAIVLAEGLRQTGSFPT